jgi:phage-related tail fiber protein
MYDSIKLQGSITATIEKCGKKQIISFPNTILTKGRVILAKALAGEIQDIHISDVLFGDGGWDQQGKRAVDANRTALFGVTRAKKSVVAKIDPSIPNQIKFIVTLANEDANGFTINEMALQFSDGNLLSMATCPNFDKTDQMQIKWVWEISI